MRLLTGKNPLSQPSITSSFWLYCTWGTPLISSRDLFFISNGILVHYYSNADAMDGFNRKLPCILLQTSVIQNLERTEGNFNNFRYKSQAVSILKSYPLNTE